MSLARVVGLVATVGLAATLTGCGQPTYRFVSSSDRDLILRVPRGWSAMNTADSLKATGIDPTTETSWAAFYDASPKPSVSHLVSATDRPVLFADSIPLTKEQAAGVTNDALLELMLPWTPADRVTATKKHIYALINSQNLASSKTRGVRVTYFYKMGTANEIFERIVLTDPKGTRVRRLYVQCSQSYYTAHKAEIDDVVTSLTLKTVH